MTTNLGITAWSFCLFQDLYTLPTLENCPTHLRECANLEDNTALEAIVIVYICLYKCIDAS